MSPPTWPVSVKGIVALDDRILLLHNERDQWELPGGRLEHDESPEECVRREVLEETGLAVVVGEVIDVWIYPVLPDRSVLVVTYGCSVDDPQQPRLSDEHDVLLLVEPSRIDQLEMPDGYRTSIERWMAARRRSGERSERSDDQTAPTGDGSGALGCPPSTSA